MENLIYILLKNDIIDEKICAMCKCLIKRGGRHENAVAQGIKSITAERLRIA